MYAIYRERGDRDVEPVEVEDDVAEADERQESESHLPDGAVSDVGGGGHHALPLSAG